MKKMIVFAGLMLVSVIACQKPDEDRLVETQENAIVYHEFDYTTGKGVLPKPNSAVYANLFVPVDGEDYYQDLANGHTFRLIQQNGNMARVLFITKKGINHVFGVGLITSSVEEAIIIEISLHDHRIIRAVQVEDLPIQGYFLGESQVFHVSGFGAYDHGHINLIKHELIPDYNSEITKSGSTFLPPQPGIASPIQEGLWVQGPFVDSAFDHGAIYINM